MALDGELRMAEEEEEEDEMRGEGSSSNATCGICELPTPKARVHYGGVSCYSCRAFFR